MHHRSAHRSRHPAVLLFVGLLLVCDVLVRHVLRRRGIRTPRLMNSTR